MTTYEYYELRGLEPQSEMPSGMFRIAKSEDGLWYERITIDGEWVMDNTLIRYLAGYSDDAYKISKKKADIIIDYFKSGQAAIDKMNGTWR
jgi:hypothetical protein